MRSATKKYFPIIVTTIVVIGLIFSLLIWNVIKSKTIDFRAGSYVLYQDDKPKPGVADMVFNEDGTCRLYLTDLLSDYLLIGRYSLENDRLFYQDELFTYVFTLKDSKTLVYLQNESNPCVKFCKQLADGTTFVLKQ